MNPRVVILTGYEFLVIGGAERLLLDLAEALDADIITPYANGDVINAYDPENKVNVISLNKKLPEEPFRQLAGMMLFRRLKPDYDVVIGIDDMALRSISRNKPHLYYMLSPRRAMYDMYYYFIDNQPLYKRPFYRVVLSIFRSLDRHYVKKNVRNIAGISHTVRSRIFRTYGKNAGVLYPPVHIERYSYRKPEGFWLSVGRIDKWKRIDLQIEAFRNIPGKELRIVGEVYPEYQSMVEKAPPNVIFTGTVSEEELRNLYSRCEGFITTAIDEDFGLTPLEAMASGKPVVATKEGGYLETVLDGYTGRLVSPDPDAIRSAVYEIAGDPEKYRDHCIKRAELFSFEEFKKQAWELLKKSLPPE
jgi:glycosyltransferase involved in cell wall biosynthesis